MFRSKSLRIAALTAAATIAGALFTASPAAAEPWDCKSPVDGTEVCYYVSDGGQIQQLMAAINAEEGHTLVWAYVALERCTEDWQACYPVLYRTGQNVEGLYTPTYTLQSGKYRTNASWVDDQYRTHTNVVWNESMWPEQ